MSHQKRLEQEFISQELLRQDCKAEYLVGPIELDILDHPDTGARIVLLGDEHVSKKKCPKSANVRCVLPIWSYLENLFKQYDGTEPLDFFLEIEFTQELRGIRRKYRTREEKKDYLSSKQDISAGEIVFGNYISNVELYFDDCFQKIKQQCAFYGKPIRFHYSDIRSGVIHSETKDIDDVKQLQELHLLQQSEQPPKEKHIEFILNLIDKFTHLDIDYIFRLMKIDKQLNKLKQVNFKLVEWLREYLLKHIEGNINLALRLYLLAKLSQSQILKEHFVTNFNDVYDQTLTDLLAPLFDIYTLARIFRHDMKQVIIYAGAFHTQKMKSFLVEKIGFRTTVSTKSDTKKTKQCIPLKNVPQPWFPV